jgi:hypothetical protein
MPKMWWNRKINNRRIYIKNKKKVKIICPKHGEFEQLPKYHISGIKKLIYTQNNDKIKTDFCLKNNIQLIRIKYDDIVDKLKNNII